MWILFLSRREIKYLELVNLQAVPEQMLYRVFFCKELTCFKFGGFNLSILPHFCGFQRLLSLHLEDVRFESSAFQSFISACPLLEELNISLCDCFEYFDFSAPTLEVLSLQCNQDMKSICLKKVNNLIDLILKINQDEGIWFDKKFAKNSEVFYGIMV